MRLYLFLLEALAKISLICFDRNGFSTRKRYLMDKIMQNSADRKTGAVFCLIQTGNPKAAQEEQIRCNKGEKEMDLSYEETMRRIAKWGGCKEKHFTWDVSVFKGESQIIVVPKITTVGYYSTYMAWHLVLSEPVSSKAIGEAVTEALEHIRISPVDARTEQERKEDFFWFKATKCRSYRSFNRKYLLCGVYMQEEGNYIVSPCESIGSNQGYGNISSDFRTALPKTASAEEIGRAVIAGLEIAEEHERTKKHDPYPPVKIELLNGDKVKIYPPRSSHFTDCDDGGAAEVHKLYEYSASEGARSAVRLFMGIAAELGCDMTENNIRTAWEMFYGKAENFEVTDTSCGIFTLRADMRNKKIRKASYLLRVAESELLECTVEIDFPSKRKKTEEKLLKIFEEFASKCQYYPKG